MALTDEDKRWIEQRMEAMEQRREAMETRLLTEFHKWASPMDTRMRSHTALLRVLDIEAEALADRVKHLEERPRVSMHVTAG